MKEIIKRVLFEFVQINEIAKLPFSEFVNKSQETHGNRYDYSQSEDSYTGVAGKVNIICREHGIYSQAANKHIKGANCPKCNIDLKRHKFSRTNDEFVRDAKKVHGNRYDYSDVNYLNTHTKVIINCIKHGPFEQRPSSHLKGMGCDKCARELQSNRQTSTTQDFIKRAVEKHGNKYDYTSVIYIKGHEPVTIICPEHGPFTQSPSRHLQGEGCPKCSGKGRNTNEVIEMFKKIHGDKYDYSQVNFKNNTTPVTIICPKHGPFNIKPDKILYGGGGCSKCAGRNLTNQEWIDRAKEVHGDKYDYSLFQYEKAIKKVAIICDKHGVFYQTPNDHINQGSGCPVCKESKGEKLVTGILKKLNINFEKQHKFKDCKVQGIKYCRVVPFDFYLPEYNTVIEYDGRHHFEPVKDHGGEENFIRRQYIDSVKNDFCKKNNINLIRIPYTIPHNDVKDFILNSLPQNK